jgi:ubiquinone biosynthesis protein
VSGLAAHVRLVGAAWTLVRADALVPREIDSRLPVGLRLAARCARLLSDRRMRTSPPGVRLAAALERLGPAAIKLGQLLSTRGDIFGAAFAEDLAHLKDRLPPFASDIARAEVERALECPLPSLFREFGEPIAAASLAQAHRAILHDGRVVAVKVLRPGIERRVREDSDTLLLAGRLAQAWLPQARRLEPLAFAVTVARTLQLELDLRFEAAGADELGVVMAADGFVAAPCVVWAGVARRVLTLEWAPGLPLSDAAALEQPGLDRRATANNLIRGFLAQALDHGVFHADLHEGNLFVEAPRRLTAVDFGIVGRLGPAERRYLAEILWGFLRRDYARISAVHFEAGYVAAHHDRAAFAQALRAIGEPLARRRANEISMGRLLAQMFEVTDLFEMRLRPELVLLQKTMIAVEGVARRLDPEHDIWAAAEPVVRRWISRELSPATKLRSLVGDARSIVERIADQAAREPVHRTDTDNPARPAMSPAVAFAAGALVATIAFVVATLLR